MALILAKYKKLLLEQQISLENVVATGEAAAETVELDQTRMGRLSRMDAMQQQEMSKASNQRRQVKLQQISAALKRIENNDYGYCKECEEDINPKRLEHSPTARLCIGCAEELES